MSNQDHVFKTPSRRAFPSMSEILKQDVSPIKPKVDNASNIQNQNLVAGFNGTPRPKTTIADVLYHTPNTKDSNRASKENLAKEPSNQDIDNTILKSELEKEKKAHLEASEKLAHAMKTKTFLDLDIQRKDDSILRLEQQLREEKAASLAAKKKYEESQQSLTATLNQEKEKRQKAENELFQRQQLIEKETKATTTQKIETNLVKVELNETKKDLAAKEKALTEKEKMRQRRSIGFHEEQRLRMQIEDELEILQEEHDEAIEKFEATIASLEKQLAQERERNNKGGQDLHLVSQAFHKQKEANHEQGETIKYLKSENLLLTKTIEDLRQQLLTSQHAFMILDQKFTLNVKENQRKLDITNEQLDILKAAQYQCNINLNKTLNEKSSETKARLSLEEKLSLEQKSKANIAEELRIGKDEIIPILENHLTLSKKRIEELENKLNFSQSEKMRAERELELEQKLRFETSQNLTNEIESRRRLETQFKEINEKNVGELKKEKSNRMRLEQELSIQLTANKTMQY